MENDVFLSSYGKIRLTLPNGRTVEAKPLPLEEANEWLGLCIKTMDNAENEAANVVDRGLKVVERYRAIQRLSNEFPALVGDVEAFADLTPVEVVGVAMRFFMESPTRNGQAPQT